MVGSSGAVRRISVATRSGRVAVTAAGGGALRVVGGEVEEAADGSATIRPTRSNTAVEIHCPEGCDVVVGTNSGSVEMRGALGDVRVTTSSGKISVERATSADLRTRSGSVDVDECAGQCRVVTSSARVRIGRAGTAEVSARSGSVTAERVDAGTVQTASGRVEVGTSSDGSLGVRSVSGSVHVTVPAGSRPEALLHSRSGSIRCDCEEGTDGRIEVSTTSGSIRVECA